MSLTYYLIIRKIQNYKQNQIWFFFGVKYMIHVSEKHLIMYVHEHIWLFLNTFSYQNFIVWDRVGADSRSVKCDSVTVGDRV